jgi:F-type H+-transporting ATPase subunit b
MSSPVLALQDHGDPRQPGAEGEHAGQPAAVAAHDEATTGQAGSDARHQGPNILSGNLGNVVFTLVIFLGVVFILGRFAWKPLLNGLQQREKFIHDSIASARQEREEADKLLARYKQQIDKAREEATAIVEEGKRDAEVVRRRIHDEARQESDAMVARARREIELAGKAAIKELYDQTAELAVRVAGKMIKKELSPDDHRELVRESLETMQGAKAGASSMN